MVASLVILFAADFMLKLSSAVTTPNSSLIVKQPFQTFQIKEKTNLSSLLAISNKIYMEGYTNYQQFPADFSMLNILRGIFTAESRKTTLHWLCVLYYLVGLLLIFKACENVNVSVITFFPSWKQY